MLAHHVITSALLFGSYGYRQLRAGNAVLIIMDAVDVIFSVSSARMPSTMRALQANATATSQRKSSATSNSKPLVMPPSLCSSFSGSLRATSAT